MSAAKRRIFAAYWPSFRSILGSSLGPMMTSATRTSTTSSPMLMPNMVEQGSTRGALRLKDAGMLPLQALTPEALAQAVPALELRGARKLVSAVHRELPWRSGLQGVRRVALEAVEAA